jgi:hypothetical protein
VWKYQFFTLTITLDTYQATNPTTNGFSIGGNARTVIKDVMIVSDKRFTIKFISAYIHHFIQIFNQKDDYTLNHKCNQTCYDCIR